MLYKRLIINGTEYFLAVAQSGKGAPTAATEGSVGVSYMDEDTGDLYKCTGAAGDVYTWEPMGAGGSGENGGYYTPGVSQPDETTVQFEFTPSRDGMPAVAPVTVELPTAPGADSGQNVNKALTFTGAVSATYDGTEEVTVNIPAATSGSAKSGYYIATDYGISTDSEDNTLALQTLVDTVSAAGGGIIFFPVGTYNFKKASTRYAVLMKSNVSIVGENIETTIFKQTEEVPYSMFYCMATATDPLTGCSFSNFTVNAYGTGDTNQVYGKAFYIQYLRDCVFRDIRLVGTIATAMGIDYLDRVVIDNVNCVDCGRTYTGTQAGTSGIGIGTGGWEEENFTISNCVCVGSGQFGIFIENQHVLGWGGNVDYSKGCIIANCIVRDGLNNGIGIRGGENVTIIGCETYENAKHGIYLDSKCKNVKILNCSSTANGASGVYLIPDSESERIVIRGCTVVENTEKGIWVAAVSGKLCIANSLTDENTIGLYIGTLTLNDCVINGNAFLDGHFVSASFDGNSDYNDFVSVVNPESINADDISVTVGRRTKVLYQVIPEDASQSVSFASSDDSIAVVSNDGNVAGVSEGDCTITITSSAAPGVTKTVNCHVSAAEIAPDITITNSEFITGAKLDSNGNQVSATGAGVTDYIAVESGVYRVNCTDLILGEGAAVCTYDANKTLLSRVSIYEQGGTEKTTGSAVVGDYNIAYIRVAFNNLASSTCVIETAEFVAEATSDMFTNGTKLMPDGSVESQANVTTTEYIAVTGLDEVSTMYAVNYWGGTHNDMIRVAQYDSNKNSLSDSFAQSTPDSNVKPMDVLDGLSFVRICCFDASNTEPLHVVLYKF